MRRTVLLIDDEPDVLFATRLMLERAGYAVVEAERGEQALAVASACRVDAIFLDLRMPDLDGWAVLRQLRAAGILPRVPVIVVSAHADPSAIERSAKVGARGYVRKPFRSADLTRALEAVLR
jgi:two-component system, sensor histidine kinase and response regulator